MSSWDLYIPYTYQTGLEHYTQFSWKLHITSEVTRVLVLLFFTWNFNLFPFTLARPKKKTQVQVTQVTGSKRHAMLFTTIVQDTKAVAIGPLEYCGNGKVIQLPHGKAMYMTVAMSSLHVLINDWITSTDIIVIIIPVYHMYDMTPPFQSTMLSGNSLALIGNLQASTVVVRRRS